MSLGLTQSAVLACHPSTPCEAIRRFAVGIRRGAGGLDLAYWIEGDIEALDIPQLGPSHWAYGLWQQTCFEAFINSTAPPQGRDYYEFNFAPSGASAAYHFTDYRLGMAAVSPMEAVIITVRRDAHRYELEAAVNLNPMPGLDESTGLRLGLSAVITDRQGGTSYWALKHPAGRPDFHHRDSFAFKLDPL